MNRIIRWLSRGGGLPALTLLVVATSSVVFLGRSDDDATGATGAVGALLVGIVIVLLAVVVIRFVLLLGGIDPEAGDIARHLADDPHQQRLLSRWLRRTRWARNIGGIAGLTWWAFGTAGQGDVLFHGVAGIAVGSMVSQLHHVARTAGPRTAGLTARSVADYLPASAAKWMAGCGVAAATLIALGLVVDDGAAAVRWGVVALAVLAAAHAVQRRVAARARPALPDGLRDADDLARELAIDRGLARPAAYCALAAIAHGVGGLDALDDWARVLAFVAWLTAFVLWWRNRRLGLDGLLRQPTLASA